MQPEKKIVSARDSTSISFLLLKKGVYMLIVASISISETQVMEQRRFSFGIKEQLTVVLQNVNEVNKERPRIAAATSICVTQPNIMVS